MVSRNFNLVAFAVVLGCRATEPMPERAPESEPEPAPEQSIEVEDPEPKPSPCELVDPPPGFVDLRTHIPSAIIVAGYHGVDNFTGAPLPGYEAPGAWLFADAADALARAAARLESDGLRLIVYDAYRPQQASVAMVDWCQANGRTDLLDDGWVAARSMHSRGLAIDVGLADAEGRALDMGSAWDQFDRHSYVRAARGPALERRLRLRDELLRENFEPYAQEWWHFTYATDRPPSPRSVAYACVD